MDALRACVVCAVVARQVGMEVAANEQAQANIQARQNGMTREDFNLEALQPKHSFCLTASTAIAGALLLGLGGFAGGLYAAGLSDEGEWAALGMIPVGAAFAFFCTGKLGEIHTNRQNADLIRRLDNGEYIPRPAPQE